MKILTWTLITILGVSSLPARADDVASERDLKPFGDMPSEDGFSGFVIVGAGNMKVKSNSMVGNDTIDIANETIVSVFDSPNSNNDGHPALTGEVAYTFANAKTQIFLGSRLEDLLTFDVAQQLGVRKLFDGVGTVSAGVLFNGIPGEVWADPYLEGSKRKNTDRESPGFRLEWRQMFGTGLAVQYSRREVDIDEERSGNFLVAEGRLDPLDVFLLERDGDDDIIKVNYAIDVSRQHVLRPEFGYRKRDRDGDAIAGEAYWAQIAYSYLHEKFALVVSVEAGESEYDDRNPVYDEYQDSEWTSLGASLFWHLRPNLSLVLVGNYADEDSDINFHDQEMTSIIAGVQYRFGQQK
jgi:hypothetical protein